MKSLSPDNVLLRPFLTHKLQSYQYTMASLTNPPQVTIDMAADSASVSNFIALQVGNPYYVGSNYTIGGQLASVNPENLDNVSIELLSSSLAQLFYSPRGFNGGVQWGFAPGTFVYAISLAQISYGEQVQPGTFQVLDESGGTGSIQDDGNGKLWIGNLHNTVGNIFYNAGVAVVNGLATGSGTGSIYNTGLYAPSGSSFIVNYRGTQTIYEHQVICTMEPNEFTVSLNPTAFMSSSVSGSGRLVDQFASGTLTPYMTTVGLYSPKGELLAIGKFPRPIKRASESQQTVIIRFDE